MTDGDAVRVCLRVRPQVAREKLELCRVCTSVVPGEPQVLLGSDRAFTFDYVFDVESRQEIIYETCVSHLIDGCFDGFNATVLAYGQTGSGKTYTMGTAFDYSVSENDEGIVPRAVRQLFATICSNRSRSNTQSILADCLVEVQFIELYNEEILDLLCLDGCENKDRKANSIRIHEDNNGNIYLSDVTKIAVNSAEQTMQILQNGALNRTTASTNMNVQSSRSHAIFTLSLRQERKIASSFDPALNEIEVLTSKFHFVDLAGSERLKRTGATGDRAKEGININSGLLALGNVISALGDASKKSSHVPYRDSKLTRLLQDSLGGNSRTLMIACVSPSDIDFVETLNTLKYANRARNIKNKVVVNQDRSSKLIHELRTRIQQLETELLEYRQGRRVNDADNGGLSDVHLENVLLNNELGQLRIRLKALQGTVENYRLRNVELTAKTDSLNFISDSDTQDVRFSIMVRKYLEEIEELKARLCESEATCEVLRKELAKAKRTLKPHENLQNGATYESFMSSCYAGYVADTTTSLPEKNSVDIINDAKREILNLKEKVNLPGSIFSADKLVESQLTSNSYDSNNNTDEDGDGDQTDSDETDGSRQHLADLQNEINIKEQLIDQLESSQKRLHAMKQQYDEKLALLMRKIQETEAERDKALSSFETRMQSQVATTSVVEKLKIDYEDKLTRMRSELNRLKSATKEHERLIKQQQENNRRLNRLQLEVSEMKNAKVSLMRKIKEDAKKSRDIELRRAKEAAQYQKDVRRRDIELRTLRIEKEKREAILKRKQDEIQALRRVQTFSANLKQRRGTVKTSAAIGASETENSNQSVFSPRAAKQRLSIIERNIVSEVRKKLMVAQMEQELSRLLQERETLARRLEILNVKKFDVLRDSKSNTNMPQLVDLNDQIESMKAKLDYVQESISECQSQIIEVDESKDESDENASDATTTCSNLQEANFLIGHLMNICVHNGARCGQNESKVRDLEIRLQQIQHDYALNEQLLKHLIGFKPNDATHAEVITASTTEKPNDITSDFHLSSDNSLSNSTTEIALQRCPSAKARRKTATPKELLFSDASTVTPMRRFLPALKEGESPLMISSQCSVDEVPSRLIGVDYSRMLPKRANSFVEQDSKVISRSRQKVQQSFEDGDLLAIPGADTVMSRSDTFTRNSPYRNTIALSVGLSKQSKGDTASQEKILSPRLLRRQLDSKDVFSRLTASKTDVNESDMDDVDGSHVMEPYSPNEQPPMKNAPLLCTHVVHGHSKDVLSLASTDDLLFTGSRDRTVCVWDLEKCKKMAALPNHPSGVSCLSYSASMRILFSASMSQVILWDMRSNERVKIFNSLGLTFDGDSNFDAQPAQTVLQPGETLINKIDLCEDYEQMLFTTVYNQIRIWDLRNFQAIGKLSSATYNQKSEIWSTSLFHGKNSIRLAAGGRDHYIKVFDLPNALLLGSHEPKVTLQPPHYDGVTCLSSSGDGRYLFSGSRDRNIIRWDLNYSNQSQNDQTKFRSQIVKAHNQWVLSMTTLPDKTLNGSEVLVSACRDGYMKLWKIETCQLIGEIRAHMSAIHCMTKNSRSLFTASRDTTVGVWKLRDDLI